MGDLGVEPSQTQEDQVSPPPASAVTPLLSLSLA